MIKKFTAAIFSLLLTLSLFSQPARTNLKNTADYLRVFDGDMALHLKKGTTKKDITKIEDPLIAKAALAMLSGTYQLPFRYSTYHATVNPHVLEKQLSIGDGYSKYENMTGVYLPIGKHTILVAGIAEGKEVKLIIPNWLRKAQNPEKPAEDPNWGLEKKGYELKNGVNSITVKDYGSLAYINYFATDPSQENPITIHFLTGEVNGYFDNATDSDKDWNRLIENQVFPILDAKGQNIQIAYPKEELKKYAYGRGKELINNYDSLVYRQYRLMGLEKYNKIPKNKILARVNYNYYMFRDKDGVAYMGDKDGYAMAMVTDPQSVITKSIWGFSHEVGHVHQTTPMFSWGGLAEVSNNLLAIYVTRSFGNDLRLSTDNNYDAVRAAVIDKKISYLLDPNLFNRLVPFWQLQLYFEGVGNNPDFYPDLFETLRQQANSMGAGDLKRTGKSIKERNPAVHQLNFVKTACAVAKVDLTDFFDAYGFFYVGDLTYDDYGIYDYKMTQSMVDQCKKEIANMQLVKPKIDISTLRD